MSLAQHSKWKRIKGEAWKKQRDQLKARLAQELPLESSNSNEDLDWELNETVIGWEYFKKSR